MKLVMNTCEDTFIPLSFMQRKTITYELRLVCNNIMHKCVQIKPQPGLNLFYTIIFDCQKFPSFICSDCTVHKSLENDHFMISLSLHFDQLCVFLKVFSAKQLSLTKGANFTLYVDVIVRVQNVVGHYTGLEM